MVRRYMYDTNMSTNLSRPGTYLYMSLLQHANCLILHLAKVKHVWNYFAECYLWDYDTKFITLIRHNQCSKSMKLIYITERRRLIFQGIQG